MPKALVVAIDGLRPDALAAADTPTLDALIADGSYSDAAQGEDMTFSAPNWSAILHGVHRDKHGALDNDYPETNLDQWPDFFTYLERHNPEWNTYRVLTWKEAHEGQPTGADIAVFRDYQDHGDERATEDLVALLAGTHNEYEADPDAIFIFYSDVDEGGHEFGFHPGRRDYLAAIEEVDGQLGRVISAMAARQTAARENWLVVVVSDHGGSADGTHSGGTPEKRTIPFIVSGPAAERGRPYPPPRNVDVATTVLAHMGVPIDAGWGLDGNVVGIRATEQTAHVMPGRPPLELGQNLLFNGGGDLDRGFTDATIDQVVSGWEDPGPCGITLVPYGTPGYPSASDAGPDDRGRNLFAVTVVPPPEPDEEGEIPEGPECVSVPLLRQTIDLGSMAADIDDGALAYALSVHVSLSEDPNTYFRFLARFLDEDGELLETSDFQPPNEVEPAAAAASELQGGATRGPMALSMGSSAGPVPAGARMVEIELAAMLGRNVVTTLPAQGRPPVEVRELAEGRTLADARLFADSVVFALLRQQEQRE